MKNLNKQGFLRNDVFQLFSSYRGGLWRPREVRRPTQEMSLSKRWFLIPVLLCFSYHETPLRNTEIPNKASYLRTNCIISAIQKWADIL